MSSLIRPCIRCGIRESEHTDPTWLPMCVECRDEIFRLPHDEMIKEQTRCWQLFDEQRLGHKVEYPELGRKTVWRAENPSSSHQPEFAHSVGTLETLKSIAAVGLRPFSSVEDASRPVYATETFRIIFSGEPPGSQVHREFAPDLPFYQTHTFVSPDRIVRIEVDVNNLMERVPTDAELADKYEAATAEYGENNIPQWWWREMSPKLELSFEVYHEGKRVVTRENYQEFVREALAGTAAANVPIVPLYITE